eukprot:TRINITY_DN8022_c0_g1_i1.p1 TRINITY_DN8022_c0_g1~~TRINITY_DN8022_c0_g1_i1.p1  ORF type:complete len:365 (+),score=60.95 TRINITY_DN8022_c0_g1_i1:189-1283(+)
MICNSLNTFSQQFQSKKSVTFKHHNRDRFHQNLRLIRCESISVEKMQENKAKNQQNVDNGEVSIRRRPPKGTYKQGCGPIEFNIDVGDENKPQNILEEIIWYKTAEVEKAKLIRPVQSLMASVKNAPPARDFKGAIIKKLNETNRPGLIAEVKKASPSRGIIQPDFDPVQISKGYEAGGAACLSVLTDEKYFQGSFNNLKEIRKSGVQCPLLCKEFIIDGYQLFLARANGADAVLLIAAVLPNADLRYFTKAALALGMQCLIEVHTIGELRRVLEVEGLENHLLGINNRDLQTFKVDLGNTEKIMQSEAGQEVQRKGLVMVGESGIFTPEHVAFVQNCGCKAILVGESIVKEGNQELAVKQLLK